MTRSGDGDDRRGGEKRANAWLMVGCDVVRTFATLEEGWAFVDHVRRRRREVGQVRQRDRDCVQVDTPALAAGGDVDEILEQETAQPEIANRRRERAFRGGAEREAIGRQHPYRIEDRSVVAR